eukprot:710239-Amorphochlora_amoeboformis.AAC.2
MKARQGRFLGHNGNAHFVGTLHIRVSNPDTPPHTKACVVTPSCVVIDLQRFFEAQRRVKTPHRPHAVHRSPKSIPINTPCEGLPHRIQKSPDNVIKSPKLQKKHFFRVFFLVGLSKINSSIDTCPKLLISRELEQPRDHSQSHNPSAPVNNHGREDCPVHRCCTNLTPISRCIVPFLFHSNLRISQDD